MATTIPLIIGVLLVVAGGTAYVLRTRGAAIIQRSRKAAVAVQGAVEALRHLPENLATLSSSHARTLELISAETAKLGTSVSDAAERILQSQQRLLADRRLGADERQVGLGMLTALDVFLAAHFHEATTEDIHHTGGLNGHLSVGRVLILHPPLMRGLADVMVAFGALFHRLHYVARMLERYAELVRMPCEEIPALRLIAFATQAKPPLERARELYSAALGAEPGHAFAAFNMAGIRHQDGHGDADELYRKSAERSTFLKPYAALRRAAIRENVQDWSQAATLYLDAAAGLKHLGPWHENAARCLRRSGRVEEALLHYERALDWRFEERVEFAVYPPTPRQGSYAESLPPLLRQFVQRQ